MYFFQRRNQSQSLRKISHITENHHFQRKKANKQIYIHEHIKDTVTITF